LSIYQNNPKFRLKNDTRLIPKERILKNFFGYDQFRPQQGEIIDHIIDGKDCMVLMPTGGGKSICFQVPALMFPGLTLVVSPLIALMHDQVQALKANGVKAAYINSSLAMHEVREIEQACRNNELKLLYVSPEKLFSRGYLDWLETLPIQLIAIDESHCVSTWGHDFRPEYTQLGTLKKSFPQAPMVALTATADRVTRKDILTQLDIPDAKVFVSSFDRPNLSLSVASGRNKLKYIEKFIAERRNQAGIIYCLSRKNTESLAESLCKIGIKAKAYHAGFDTATRTKTQNEFLNDELQVVCATIAFGMGIDKSNVRWVMHYSVPANVEGFYQEIGRAGRDGTKADTLLFYSYNEIAIRKDMVRESNLPEEMKEIQYAKIERMKQYAEAQICRRRILLSYFNEEVQRDCGNCDVCKNPPQRFDGTILAQKALSAIARTQEKVAMGMLIDVLRGSNNRKIFDNKFHEIKTFGAGKDLKYEEWADYILQMMNMGLMDIAHDKQHIFELNNFSRQVLGGQKMVQLAHYKPFEEKQAEREAAIPKEKNKREVIKDALFEHLRTLRKKIADERKVPPYVIMSDATLSDMAQKKPFNKTECLQVSGIGDLKYQQFGEIFIKEIKSFINQLSPEEKMAVEKRNVFLMENNTTGNVSRVDTYQYTYELYKEGNDIDQIAVKRQLSPTTILGHLCKFFDEGVDIDLMKYISAKDYVEITRVAKQMNYEKTTALKPIFEAMEEKHDYQKLRIALAIWFRENGG
jgi:ATP-dependent DNA helicase RecQ